jgi:hypothetical protein
MRWKSEDRESDAEAAKHQRAQGTEVNGRSAVEGFLFHKKGCSGCEAQLRENGFKAISLVRSSRNLRSKAFIGESVKTYYRFLRKCKAALGLVLSNAAFGPAKNDESEGDKFCRCRVGCAK